jgi:hypothetical protein
MKWFALWIAGAGLAFYAGGVPLGLVISLLLGVLALIRSGAVHWS